MGFGCCKWNWLGKDEPVITGKKWNKEGLKKIMYSSWCFWHSAMEELSGIIN